MSISKVQYASGVKSSNTLVYGSTPTNGNLMLGGAGFFQNGTFFSLNSWASVFNHSSTAQQNVAGGYKYAGASESTSQTVGSLGVQKDLMGWEVTGVSGTIGTDAPTSHNNADVASTGSNPYTYNTTSFNTAAANTGIVGFVGSCTVNNNSDTYTSAALSGGVAPVLDETFIDNTSGNRHTLWKNFTDYFATNATGVSYTLGGISGTFTTGGAPVGVYGLISVVPWTAPVTGEPQMRRFGLTGARGQDRGPNRNLFAPRMFLGYRLQGHAGEIDLRRGIRRHVVYPEILVPPPALWHRGWRHGEYRRALEIANDADLPELFARPFVRTISSNPERAAA